MDKFFINQYYRDERLYTTNPLFIYKINQYYKYSEKPVLGVFGVLILLLSFCFYGPMIDTSSFNIVLFILGTIVALNSIIMIILGIIFKVLEDKYEKVFDEFLTSNEYKKQIKDIDKKKKKELNLKKKKKATELVEVYSILNSKQSKEDKVKLIQKYMKED